MRQSLQKMVDACDKWVFSATYHCDEADSKGLSDYFLPKLNEDPTDLLCGINLLGSPSNLLYKNEGDLFDKYLVWILDCEFYYRLHKKWGEPTVLEEPCVVTRNRESSVSDMDVNYYLAGEELHYSHCKHNVMPTIDKFHNMQANAIRSGVLDAE